MKALKMLSALTVLMLVLAPALAGCATGAPAATGSPAGQGTQAPDEDFTPPPKADFSGTKIKFSSFQTGDVEKDWIDVQFKAFEQETGIQVEHVFINHADTISTLMTWTAAGTAPDAAMISANYQNSLAANQLLVNLDTYIKEHDPDYDLVRFHEKLLDTYRYNGELYALPSDMDLAVMWYNKDMLDKAGISYPPAEGWTWQEYRDAALRLTSGEGPTKVFGSTMPDYQLMIWSNGGSILSDDGKQCLIDSPEAKEALQMVADSVLTDKFAPAPGAVEGDAFQLKHAAIAFTSGPWYSHYVLADVDFSWDIAPVPHLKKQATTTYGSSFAILESSKSKDAAWEFLKWFLTDEQQTIRADKFAWFPPSKTLATSDEFMKDGVMGMTGGQKSLIIGLAQYGNHPVVVQKQSEVQKVLEREFTLVWAGDKKVDDAVAAIMAEVPALLN